MLVTNERKWRKREQAESRVGMPVAEYLKQATAAGVSQLRMAQELGVSMMTVRQWLDAEGYRVDRRYLRDRRAK